MLLINLSGQFLSCCLICPSRWLCGRPYLVSVVALKMGTCLYISRELQSYWRCIIHAAKRRARERSGCNKSD